MLCSPSNRYNSNDKFAKRTPSDNQKRPSVLATAVPANVRYERWTGLFVDDGSRPSLTHNRLSLKNVRLVTDDFLLDFVMVG